MATIKVTLNPDGSVRVDNEMPDGPACDEADAKLRAVMQLLGVGLEDITDDPDAPRQPEAQVTKNKVGQGGGT